MYMNWFTWIIFIPDCICYTKIGGNYNSPYSLNMMVNYYYHDKNRVITGELPPMVETTEFIIICIVYTVKF